MNSFEAAIASYVSVFGLLAVLAFACSNVADTSIRGKTGSIGLVDIAPMPYDGETLQQWLGAMGEEGRKVHIVATCVVDTVILFTFFPLLAALLLRVAGRHVGTKREVARRLAHAAVIPMIADVVENVLVVRALISYHEGGPTPPAEAIMAATVTKFAFSYPLLLTGLVWFAVTYKKPDVKLE